MEDTPDLPERRSVLRHALALPVWFSEGAGLTRDLSAEGVFFMTDALFLEGQPVRLSIGVEHVDSECRLDLVCQGRVCRVEHRASGGETQPQMGVAVAFDSLGVQALGRLTGV